VPVCVCVRVSEGEEANERETAAPRTVEEARTPSIFLTSMKMTMFDPLTISQTIQAAPLESIKNQV